jgi:hypothetical protein
VGGKCRARVRTWCVAGCASAGGRAGTGQPSLALGLGLADANPNLDNYQGDTAMRFINVDLAGDPIPNVPDISGYHLNVERVAKMGRPMGYVYPCWTT